MNIIKLLERLLSEMILLRKELTRLNDNVEIIFRIKADK